MGIELHRFDWIVYLHSFRNHVPHFYYAQLACNLYLIAEWCECVVYIRRDDFHDFIRSIGSESAILLNCELGNTRTIVNDDIAV